MVYITKLLLDIPQSQLGKHLKRPFIDKLRVFVKAGNGGMGNKSIGGIGGDGGSVYIKAKHGLKLKDVYSTNLKKRYVAGNGENSIRIKPFGNKGQDIEILVPCGITVIREDGEQYLGEVNTHDERVLIVKGGKGGKVRLEFETGEKFMVHFDLKLIADVGLVGFPNAGKSTLLSIVSRARPKIANYPFTTIHPQIGIIEYEDKRVITIADLPGLIEGAHFNRGMGHKFLKHISRTKMNLFIIDIDGFQLSNKFEKRTAFETLIYLNKELEMYDSSLLDKPSILILNKIDLPDSKELLDAFHKKYENYEESIKSVEEYWRPEKKMKFNEVLEISVKDNKNVDELCVKIRDLIDTATV